MALSEAATQRRKLHWHWILGYAAIIFVVAIWASFALSVRAIHNAGLTEADLALIRYGIPGLVLAPFIAREWPRFRRMKPLDAIFIMSGGGLPFFFFVAYAGSQSSAAIVGSMVTGTLPVTVILVAWLLEKRAPTRTQILPSAIIMSGVCLLISSQLILAPINTLTSASMLLLGGFLWAFYTVALRRAALTAIGSAIMLCVPNAICLLLLTAIGYLDVSLTRLMSLHAVPFIASQGIGAGLLAGLAYPFAIARIGGIKAALFGSLTPAVTCLAAWALLDEQPAALTLLGVSAITIGVAMGNLSSFKKVRRSATYSDH